MRAYREFLAVHGVKPVLIAAVFGRMPTGMLPLAIVLLVTSAGGSLAAAGLAAGGFGLASAAAMPVQGALAAALGTIRLLAIVTVGHSIALVTLVVAAESGQSSAVLVVLSACAGALLPPIMAYVRALWTELAPDTRTRDAAFALDSIGVDVAWILGPVLVVASVAVASASATIVLCAVITACGILGFASSKAVRGSGAGVGAVSRVGLFPSRSIYWLLGSILFFGVYWGTVQVGLPALAIEADAEWASGVLLTLVSVGSLAAALVYGALTWRVRVVTRYAALLVALGLVTTPLIVVHGLTGVALISVCTGLALGPTFSAMNALMANAAPTGLAIQSFTWSTSAAFGGMALGSGVAGLVADYSGVGAPFAVGALAAVVAAAVIWTGSAREARNA
jgi:MFS family permease